MINLWLNWNSKSSMSRRSPCKACGAIGTVVEDASNGYRVCSNCGTIVGEAVLINEVEFTEMQNGNSARNGQFVVAPSQKQNYATSTQSSIEGKMRIQAICDQLSRLDNQPDVCELAERIFKKALHERFIRGRTIEIVAAACVYVAIRQKKSTGYLLCDVADHIDCGIFELAATALRLATCVNEVMPVIDPTLYVDRFTDELKFGRQAPEIKETAIKIIRRMDRDWIQTGRKPAGVCGAAIMLAARIQGVDVTKDMIMKCARVCSSTINKRLREISQTALAEASINELRENEDIISREARELPPAMSIRKRLQEVAAAVETPVKDETPLNDNFSDDELADVDGMILGEEEMEKRSALFYTMYKSKLNEPPKEPKVKKAKKKRSDDDPGNRGGDEEGGLILEPSADMTDRLIGDDDMLGGSDAGDFEDIDFD